MTEFEFDKESADRIEKVIQQNPMSLQDCADILELAAPLCTVFSCECFKNKLKTVAESLY